MAWLSGWDNRIKLTIDNTKIDSALTHFPVTVFLTSTHGDCVFDELTADANRFKIAFTKADGTTQLYGEIERWVDADEIAIIHVSLSGWSIASGADTDFYMYYDVDHADNTAYIGDIDSTPGHSVWDSNFKLVCHMVDLTTSTLKDSTSNNNDGTKKGANEPIEENGKEQHFDGVDDYITTPTLLDVVSANGTVSIYLAPDDTSEAEAKYLLYKKNDNDNRLRCYWLAAAAAGSRFVGFEKYNATVSKTVISTTSLTNTYYLITGTWGSGGMVLYVNGVSEDTDPDTNAIVNGTDYDFTIGCSYDLATGIWDGIHRELRVSDNQRNVSWTKAEYNSLFDTLITYGTGELRKTVSESFSVVDSKVTSISKALAEAFNTIDSWAAKIAFDEAFSVADSIVKSAIKQLAEAFSVADSFAYTVILRFYEVLSVKDSFTTYLKSLWHKVTKEIAKFTKVTKEIDDWDKVNKEKGDWDKTDKE